MRAGLDFCHFGMHSRVSLLSHWKIGMQEKMTGNRLIAYRESRDDFAALRWRHIFILVIIINT